jgi:hypothetical protein
MSNGINSRKSIITVTDRFVKGPIVVQSDHAYIHDGLGYDALIDAGTIDAAYNISFKTPTVASGKYIHWRPTSITTSADYVQGVLYEGDTYTDGTAVTPVNRNRNSSNTSTMQAVAKGTTTTPAGTIIDIFGVGSTGRPQARSGNASGSEQERVLKQNTIYTLVLTPAGETDVTATLFWYEETEGV